MMCGHQFICFLLVFSSSVLAAEQEPWEENLRLPTTAIPYHYDLMLFPNLKTEQFSGRVSITIGVTEPMTYLLTHTKKMNITKTQLLEDSTGEELEILESFEYEPHQFWVIKPKLELKPSNNYTLLMEFHGNLRGGIKGLYLSEYVTKSGEKRYNVILKSIYLILKFCSWFQETRNDSISIDRCPRCFSMFRRTFFQKHF